MRRTNRTQQRVIDEESPRRSTSPVRIRSSRRRETLEDKEKDDEDFLSGEDRPLNSDDLRSLRRSIKLENKQYYDEDDNFPTVTSDRRFEQPYEDESKFSEMQPSTFENRQSDTSVERKNKLEYEDESESTEEEEEDDNDRNRQEDYKRGLPIDLDEQTKYANYERGKAQNRRRRERLERNVERKEEEDTDEETAEFTEQYIGKNRLKEFTSGLGNRLSEFSGSSTLSVLATSKRGRPEYSSVDLSDTKLTPSQLLERIKLTDANKVRITGVNLYLDFDIHNWLKESKEIVAIPKSFLVNLKRLTISANFGSFNNNSFHSDYLISKATNLTYLNTYYIQDITILKKLPLLTYLRIYSTDIELDKNVGQPLSQLTNLETLILGSFSFKNDNLSALSPLVNLKNLVVSFSGISSLYGIEELKSLESLRISFNGTVEDLSLLNELKKLKTIKFYNLNIEEIADLSGCEELRELYIYNLSKLSILNLTGCKSLTKLELKNPFRPYDDIPSKILIESSSVLPSLETFSLGWGFILDDFSFLNQLPNLKELYLDNFLDIEEDLSLLSNLVKIEKLYINNPHIKSLNGLVTDNLTSLFLDAKPLEDISALSECKTLANLNLKFCVSLKDISPLSSCINLKRLNLSSIKFSNIKALENCTKLETLDISETNVKNLTSLSNCSNLAILKLAKTKVKRLFPLKQCKNLVFLNVNFCKNLKTLDGIQNCKKLQYLYFEKSNLRDLSPIGFCTSLTNLIIGEIYECSLKPISLCKNLKMLKIDYMETITDYDSLFDLPFLIKINDGSENRRNRDRLDSYIDSKDTDMFFESRGSET